jgi:hypothetical protein
VLMRGRILLLGLVVLATGAAMPRGVQAQSVDQVATMPPNVVLANYDSVPIGPFGGLEGGAYVARVSDSSAAWFNPAGLSREPGAQVSASAGVYKWIGVSPEHLPHSGGSVQNVPNFVGGTFHLKGALTAGAVFLTTNSWLQEIDSELITPVQNGQERLGYSAESQFVRRIAAIGAGYQIGAGWRVGAGLSISMVDLRLVQGISDRVADTSSVRTLLVSARASGTAEQLRAQGGVQYDTPLLRFGAAIRTPGLTARREGTIILDGIVDQGATSLGSSLFDANARFDYRLPWELQAGVAYVADRGEAEINVRAYTPIAAYSLLATDEPVRIYADASGNSVPAVTTRPFGSLTSASDGVVNVTIGGHARLIRGRNLRVHAGFATSRSPVGAADQVFNRVDTSSWSVGLSEKLTKFQFAVGINLRTGAAADVLVRNVLTGGAIRRQVDVSAGGLIYSIAYQF